MLTSTPLTEQIDAAQTDPMRIVVVGAGVAGLTVAQLLRRAGRHPVLLEKAGEASGTGYVLGLLPLVDPVLEQLDLRADYLAASTGFDRYRLKGHTGRALRTDDFRRIFAHSVDGGVSYRGIDRGRLLEVLSAAGGTASYETMVTRIEQAVRAQVVTFLSAGQYVSAEFDLVIVADGLRSTTRRLVLDPYEVEELDTGWSGWVAWAAPDSDNDLGEEVWGAGFLIGSYPVRDALGVIAGGPNADVVGDRRAFVGNLRRRLEHIDDRLDRVLTAISEDDEAYCWPMTDCRSTRWVTGRVVLLGDAAAGFLPTAGVGAGMAMECAGVLARLVIGSEVEDIPAALRTYETIQRPRVEIAQNTSRQLARLTFSRNRLLAVVREQLAARLSIGAALRPITKLVAASPLAHPSGGLPDHQLGRQDHR